jgi:prolipoprotein diacylglyceryl transferase
MRGFIPTPSLSAVELGPLTIHFYAIFILLGVVVALIIGVKRYAKAGGDPHEIIDCAIFAIPAGVVGGRLYHVITSPELYFSTGKRPIDAVKIWDGGMGIWGAIALGTLAAYIFFKRQERSSSFAILADSLAPGILLAQAIGRCGNWFNGELFGRPTRLPWGLVIPQELRPIGFTSYQTFHPTFLYEALWCILACLALLIISKRFLLAPGNLFIGYIFLYCCGRLGIEHIRIDSAHIILGLRLNEWVSALGIVLAGFTFIYRHLKSAAGQNR